MYVWVKIVSVLFPFYQNAKKDTLFKVRPISSSPSSKHFFLAGSISKLISFSVQIRFINPRDTLLFSTTK